MAKRKGTTTAGVEFIRNEVDRMLPAYYLIRDVLAGELAIKGFLRSDGPSNATAFNNGTMLTVDNSVLSAARRYLPQPDASDNSSENLERYRAYVTRAVFYEVTGRTLEGMAGQVFLRDPVVALPSALEMMKTNADGGGLTLDQCADQAVRRALPYGRTGLLVDYPIQGAPLTKAVLAKGNIQPTFTVYDPWDIINWRVEKDGAKIRLTMVVLRESIDNEIEDGFELSTQTQYRVLKLDPNGNHFVEMYSKGVNGRFTPSVQTYPKDSKGKFLQEIPFRFIGSQNNNVSADKPPLYGMASINIAHYRNSADYEESCFIVGQPTPVFSGLTQDWVKNVLKDKIPLGARASIPLPENAKAELLQAAANIMPMEAMKHKEEQMVALGAKLVQLQKTVKTATEQIIETTSESSVLATVSKNVSSAFEWGLGIAAGYVGAAVDGIKYQLNKDFDLTSMTADDQNAIIQGWIQGALSFTEMRSGMRRAGLATQDDVAARKEIESDITGGFIPDPSMQTAGAAAVPPAKAASDAGGPQPKPIRRASKP